MDRQRKRHPVHRREIRLMVAHEEHPVGRRELNIHRQSVTNNGNHEGIDGQAIEKDSATLNKIVGGTKLQSQLVMQCSIHMRRCSPTTPQR